MKTNKAGVDIIKKYEGLRLDAYKCPAGVWTIGYGHTGDEVVEGIRITKDQAEKLLEDDLEKFEERVSRMLGLIPSNENQFSAMVSLGYNIGLGAFKTSSVLRLHK